MENIAQGATAPAKPKRTRKNPKPCLPAFKPVFTEDQVRTFEAEYNENWGSKRRLVMISLARTAAQMAEGFKDIDAEAFTELLGHFDDFKLHCKAGVELAEMAADRMLVIATHVANTSEEERGHG